MQEQEMQEQEMQEEEMQEESTLMEVEGTLGYHGDSLSCLGVSFLSASTSISGVNFLHLLTVRVFYIKNIPIMV